MHINIIDQITIPSKSRNAEVKLICSLCHMRAYGLTYCTTYYISNVSVQ